MVFHDLKQASSMAIENIFGGIILPTILVGLLSIPVFLFVIPILNTPSIGIPIVLATACFISAIYAGIYAQIPLEGQVKRPVINAISLAFCHPINALLYPFHVVFSTILLFPITLVFIATNLYLGQAMASVDTTFEAIVPVLGQIIGNTMFGGAVNAASLALWGYFQIPRFENRLVVFSITDMFNLAIGAGIRGAIAALFIFPILALFIIEIVFIINSMDNGGPNLGLVIGTFFTGLFTAAAVAIPFLSGVAYLRREYFGEGWQGDEEEHAYYEEDEDFTVWKDQD